MATKKKSKKKAKKTKSRVKAKKPAVKKTKAKKKVVKKKATTRKPAKKAARKKMVAAKPAAQVALPGEERVGMVTHYYNHLSVAIIKLEGGTLRTGDTVHIKGHTSDFRQMVGSMELDHVHVDLTQSGQSFGLRVVEHAREHDTVYKVTKP